MDNAPTQEQPQAAEAPAEPAAAPEQQEAKPAEPAAPEAEAKPERADDDYEGKIEDVIEAAKNDELLTSEENHKGINIDETLKDLPDDAKKMLSNMRKDYTHKMQALAEERRNLDAQRKAMLESDAYKTIQQAAEKQVGEFDPYDPDSFGKHIEHAVAKKVADLYKPVQQEYELQQTRGRLQAFVAEHPDVKENVAIRDNVRDMLMKNEHMTLETAYWAVKGKHLQEGQVKMVEENQRYKDAMKEAGLKIGGGAKVGDRIGPPKGLDAYGIYKWYETQGSKGKR